MIRAVWTLAILAALTSCSAESGLGTNPSDVTRGDADPSDGGSNPSCSVTAPTSCPDPAPRYTDVAPIFEQRCIPCHSGSIDGPWPLTSYEHVADWQDFIRAAMLDCTMPPADAGVPITRDERMAILTWIRCALPR